MNPLDRRSVLLGSIALLAGLSRASAQKSPAGESRMLSDGIASFVTGFDLKTVPPLAIERARAAFVDTVGVMLAGGESEPAAIIRDMVKAEAAAPKASVVGTAIRTSPQLAALANGVASHALDFDLTYTQGQLTAPLIPALLPLAESTSATQSELLAAYIVGFEVCSRFTRANPDHNGGGSWHGTGTIGAIAAAASCARLLKVPAAEIPSVIGIAVSLASGVNANYGTMTKPLHNGEAARSGMMAAMLGQHGFTASRSAIEGKGGFAVTFARGLEWHPEQFDDLGIRSDLAEVGYAPKRYPCGGVIHTAIDAALKIGDDLGPRVADITAIKAGIAGYAADRAKPEYPTNTEAAKFNLQYVVAQTLVNGVPKLETFDEAARGDPRVKALAQKISVGLDPEFKDARGDYPARLAVTLKDGRTVTEVVYAPVGSAKNPMTAAQLEQKFFDCAAYAKVAKPTADRIFATLSHLGDQPALGELWPLLAKA